MRGLLKAQFGATSVAEKSRSVSDVQKVIDRAILLDFTTALEMTGLFLSTLYSRKTVAFARKRSGNAVKLQDAFTRLA